MKNIFYARILKHILLLLVPLVQCHIRYLTQWEGNNQLQIGSISTTKIPNRKLGVSPIKKVLSPENLFECEEECMITTGCVSFNVIEKTKSDEIDECQLLDRDHFSNPFDLTIANGNFHVVYVSLYFLSVRSQ